MLFFHRTIIILIILFLTFMLEGCQTEVVSFNENRNDNLTMVEVAVGEWKPFITEDFEGYGEITELVSAILEQMDHKPDYQFMSWGQAEKIVRKNEKDSEPRVTFPYRDSNKRRREFLISDQPVFENCIRFFYNEKKINQNQPLEISSIDELKSKSLTIGYVSEGGGYQYPKKLDSLLQRKGVGSQFDTLYEAFSKLVDLDQKNVQVVPEVQAVGEELLYEFFPEQQFNIKVIKEKQDKCLLPVKYYLMASKWNPHNTEFMEKFNKAYGSVSEETKKRIEIRSHERPTPKISQISLDTCGESGNILGYDEQNKPYYLIRGTKGLLLDWKLGKPGNNVNTERVKAKVEILTGPYRGKKLTLNGNCIILQ